MRKLLALVALLTIIASPAIGMLRQPWELEALSPSQRRLMGLKHQRPQAPVPESIEVVDSRRREKREIARRVHSHRSRQLDLMRIEQGQAGKAREAAENQTLFLQAMRKIGYSPEEITVFETQKPKLCRQFYRLAEACGRRYSVFRDEIPRIEMHLPNGYVVVAPGQAPGEITADLDRKIERWNQRVLDLRPEIRTLVAQQQ